MNFLVAYDIGEPGRLRQVAKVMERSARRVQKSVFVFTGTRRQLDDLIKCLIQEIDPVSDRIQAWPVRTSSRWQRMDAGAGLPEMGVAVVVSAEQCLVIEAIDEPHSRDHDPLVL
jgi:CRISPR-associated protein Cas2